MSSEALNAGDSPALREIARKLLWWKTDPLVQDDPVRFACQVMTFGTWNDVTVVRRELGDALFRNALADPPPGVFDERSWNYWHLVYGIVPVPPLPIRKLA